jgi:transposase
MITIAVDLSKRTSQYSIFDSGGKRVARCKLENSTENILGLLKQYPGPKTVAVEATRNWGLFHDTVADHVDRFLLGHPAKMKIITQSEIKNDRNDADRIGQLVLSGFLPQAHVCDSENRQLRSILRFRQFLVKQRSAVRNQIQTLLDRNLWPCQRPLSFKDPFCKRGIRWMKELELPEKERFILNRCLDFFEELSHKILGLEREVQGGGWALGELKYLCQIPGFRKGGVNAYVVLTEVAGIERFHKARHLAHYAGLIPSERSSGDIHRTGRLVKGANMRLRTAIIESTFAAVRSDAGLKAYYQKVKKQNSSSAAVVACARKLCYAIYHVLKHKTKYQPFQPLATAC